MPNHTSDQLHLDFYIESAISDDLAVGAATLTQKWFMLYNLLLQHRYIQSLNVTPLNPSRIPVQLKQIGIGPRLPVLVIRVDGRGPVDQAATEQDRETLLDEWTFGGGFSTNTRLACLELVFELMPSLNLLLTTGKCNRVDRCLRQLDVLMGEMSTRFLEGDQPGYADCCLGPKLHHLRVAGQHYRGYSIPASLTNLSTYIDNLNRNQAFTTSCPSDRDILLHYLPRSTRDRRDMHSLGRHQLRLLSIDPHQRSLIMLDDYGSPSLFHSSTTSMTNNQSHSRRPLILDRPMITSNGLQRMVRTFRWRCSETPSNRLRDDRIIERATTFNSNASNMGRKHDKTGNCLVEKDYTRNIIVTGSDGLQYNLFYRTASPFNDRE